MGRYNVVKCDDLAAIKTRALADTPAMAPTAAVGRKLRKVSASSARTTPYSVHQLRSRRRRSRGTVTRENSAPDSSFLTETTATANTTVTVLRNCEDIAGCCSGGEEVVSCNDDDFMASCCSSNVASSSSEDEVVKECTAISTSEIVADPEVESGETSSRFGESCEAPAREPDAMTTAKATVQIKMPSESEIDDFFSAAENDLQKRFSDKYNFDIVKDVPLEGRYEWVQIKP